MRLSAWQWAATGPHGGHPVRALFCSARFLLPTRAAEVSFASSCQRAAEPPFVFSIAHSLAAVLCAARHSCLTASNWFAIVPAGCRATFSTRRWPSPAPTWSRRQALQVFASATCVCTGGRPSSMRCPCTPHLGCTLSALRSAWQGCAVRLLGRRRADAIPGPPTHARTTLPTA